MKQTSNNEILPSPAPSSGVALQSAGGGCTCGNARQGSDPASSPTYVYAIGQIQPRFPTPGVEKELAQVIGRSEASGQTDWQAHHSALAKQENRYLVRRLCWVLTIEGLDAYLLLPRDPSDYELLVDMLRFGPKSTDVDVVIGVRGQIAPPDMCNGLQAPIIGFEQIYSFDVNRMLEAIPRPPDIAEDKFSATAEEVFHRIMQLADNVGATDEHRALNYLAVRHPTIYAIAAEAHGRNAALASVEVRPSRLGSVRKIVDVVFSFVNRATDVAEKYLVRVDVTEVFPFLVSKMAPFYDR